MRFWAGLATGAVLGAILTWLAMARPWRSEDKPTAQAPADAAPELAVSKKKGKRGRRGPEAPAPVLSASDRERVWRGPALSLPERSVDLGNDSEARPLRPDEIDDAMRRSAQPIMTCIETALAGAELSSEVELEMLVSGAGAVQKVRIGAPRWLMAHGFAECASAAARRVRFPGTGAATIVNAPFHVD